ncbi:MAG: FliH/SctL family protein [Parvularculaceae bacterium]
MARARVEPFAFRDFDEPAAQPVAEHPVALFDPEELDRVRKAAFAGGVESARREAAAEASQALSALASSFGDQVAEFDAVIAAERRSLKAAAADFLKAFAAAIVKEREVEIALDLLRRLFAASSDRAPAELLLNPESLKLVGDRLKKEIAAQGASSFISLRPDAALAPGDCRLQWRGGAVDRRLAQAVEEIDAMFARANLQDAIAPRGRSARKAAKGD